MVVPEPRRTEERNRAITALSVGPRHIPQAPPGRTRQSMSPNFRANGGVDALSLLLGFLWGVGAAEYPKNRSTSEPGSRRAQAGTGVGVVGKTARQSYNSASAG